MELGTIRWYLESGKFFSGVNNATLPAPITLTHRPYQGLAFLCEEGSEFLEKAFSAQQ